MELLFKGSASKPFKLEGVGKEITVKELKALCQGECSLSAEQQRLFYKGKQLQDDQTLEELRISDKATLFLVKGVTAEAAKDGDAALAKKIAGEEKQEDPEARVLCSTAGCGFFGTAKSENLCSKCFRDKAKKEEDSDKAKRDEAKKAVCEDASVKKVEEDKSEEPPKEEQKDTNRCWTCNKKIGLMGFQCKCDYWFCATHRHAEDHSCVYDHKEHGRAILAKTTKGAT